MTAVRDITDVETVQIPLSVEVNNHFSSSTQVDGRIFDTLLIEGLKTIEKSTHNASNRSENQLESKNIPTVGMSEHQKDEIKHIVLERKINTYSKMEAIGFRVGAILTERLIRTKPRFSETLDSIKFVCKDLWINVFGKQIDNLKTNNHGVFVLADYDFRSLTNASPIPTIVSASDLSLAETDVTMVLAFPTGIIRGSMLCLGLACSVTANANTLPTVTFQVRIAQ